MWLVGQRNTRGASSLEVAHFLRVSVENYKAYFRSTFIRGIMGIGKEICAIPVSVFVNNFTSRNQLFQNAVLIFFSGVSYSRSNIYFFYLQKIEK